MTGPAKALGPVLGIDPGSRRTGYAAIVRVGRSFQALESGTIRLPERAPLSQRLALLQRALDAVLDRSRPVVVAVEDLFSARNARSALALGQARGAALATVGLRELHVHHYPPATVKKAVAGHGRAGKEQIQRMVQLLLALDGLPQADEADAMAIAICHHLCSRGTGSRP